MFKRTLFPSQAFTSCADNKFIFKHSTLIIIIIITSSEDIKLFKCRYTYSLAFAWCIIKITKVLRTNNNKQLFSKIFEEFSCFVSPDLRGSVHYKTREILHKNAVLTLSPFNDHAQQKYCVWQKHTTPRWASCKYFSGHEWLVCGF